MVPGMAGPPAMIRCESEKSGNNTPEAVGFLRPEKRPVAAVVEDDKYADQKPAHNHRYRECDPERVIERAQGDIPQDRVRDQAVGQLPDTAQTCWTLIRGYVFLKFSAVNSGSGAGGVLLRCGFQCGGLSL